MQFLFDKGNCRASKSAWLAELCGFLSLQGGEGKALDLEGFRRVLEQVGRRNQVAFQSSSSPQVAARVDMPAQDGNSDCTW